jgi:hypothetical protein
MPLTSHGGEAGIGGEKPSRRRASIQKRFRPQARRGQGRLRPGVPTAHHNDIVSLCRYHTSLISDYRACI